MLRCLALLACVPLSGCATLSGSRVEYLRVDSIPQGAAVNVNGVGGGYTPAAVEVDKHHPSVVQVSMAGQPPVFCSTEMSASPGYVAADVILCLLLFPIGCISFIDAAGAWNELSHPVCMVHFAPGTPPPVAPPQGPPTSPPRYPPPSTPPPSTPPPPAPPSHD